MKLKNEDIDSIDLTEEERKSRWAAEVVEAFTGRIPVMTSIPKDSKSTQVHLFCMARHADMAAALIHQSKRFRTTSEVFRAALYIGISILYYLFKDDGTEKDRARASNLYAVIQAMEGIHHSQQCVDAVTDEVRTILHAADSGVIDFEEMRNHLNTLVEALPVELRKTAKRNIKHLMDGDKITNIMFSKVARGVRKR